MVKVDGTDMHRLRSTSIHEITLNSVTFTWEDNCHFHSCVSCTQLLFLFFLDTFDTQKWLAPCNATDLPVVRVRAHGNGHRRVANGGALEAPRPIPGALNRFPAATWRRRLVCLWKSSSWKVGMKEPKNAYRFRIDCMYYGINIYIYMCMYILRSQAQIDWVR